MLLTCGLTTHASAAPETMQRASRQYSSEAAARSAALGADTAPAHTVILGPDGLPNDPYIGVYNGWAGITTTLYIGKLKQAVRIPQIVAAVYSYGSDSNGFLRAPSWALPDNPVPGCGYWVGYVPGNVFIADVDQPDKTKPGTVRSIGVLPDTKVHALILGSVPVSATLHLRQQGEPGEVTPITARQFAQSKTIAEPLDPNTPEGSGQPSCDPDFNLPGTVVASGQLIASLSDVRIDGKSVDVGNRCRALAPTELRANGNDEANGGNYKGILGGGPLIQQLNRTKVPGNNRVKLFPGAVNVTVAPFTGCRDSAGRQDLSRLLTTFISGSANTASLYQGVPVLNNTPGTDKTSLCGDDGTGTRTTICADDPLPYVAPVAPGR